MQADPAMGDTIVKRPIAFSTPHPHPTLRHTCSVQSQSHKNWLQLKTFLFSLLTAELELILAIRMLFQCVSVCWRDVEGWEQKQLHFLLPSSSGFVLTMFIVKRCVLLNGICSRNLPLLLLLQVHLQFKSRTVCLCVYMHVRFGPELCVCVSKCMFNRWFGSVVLLNVLGCRSTY